MARTLLRQRVRVVLKMNTFDEKLQDTLSGRKGAYTQIHEAFNNLKAGRLSLGGPLHGHQHDHLPAEHRGAAEAVGVAAGPEHRSLFRDDHAAGRGAGQHNSSTSTTQQAEEFFHKIAEIDRTKYGHHWDPKPPLVGGDCLRHQFSCAVNSEGYVQPCVGVTIPIGNVQAARS